MAWIEQITIVLSSCQTARNGRAWGGRLSAEAAAATRISALLSEMAANRSTGAERSGADDRTVS